MIGYLAYVVLFAIGTLPIVVVTSFLSHADDRGAFRDLPRRAMVFVGSCIALAAALVLMGLYVG
ncbi:hypothetical protein [Engelhardtia mirabilis]|uniref:Uncharacterized protein n=1 Tax=Engelhardtia mirabilis TaxID=2528011 RepID=A0A518BQL4_9BACT|nr:hypothetical protein Pla133_43870 [Planctomycetes bacterium Pla133]QDV03595.1 hypothetical protein Pla86_43860 [Planctomycetes bacterium Pla86]